MAGGGQGGASKWGSGFETDKATIAVNDFSGVRVLMKCRTGVGSAPAAQGATRLQHNTPTHARPRARADPNPFFKALLSKPFRGAVVLSPGIYDSAAPPPPPHDADESGGEAPPAAWPAGAGPIKIMDTTFGYLSREGYCAGADCQRFAVAASEFSSKLSGGPHLAALNAFAAHLNSVGVDYGGVGTWRFWGFDDAPPAAS